MADHIVRDSGKREDFSTGSRRDTREGKGRFDLIPPIPLRRLALVYERGSIKYGDHNWEKGQPLSRYLDSALRHINAYREGDRVEDHLAQAAWNLFGYIHTEEKVAHGQLPAELDDVNPPPPLPYAAMPPNLDPCQYPVPEKYWTDGADRINLDCKAP